MIFKRFFIYGRISIGQISIGRILKGKMRRVQAGIRSRPLAQVHSTLSPICTNRFFRYFTLLQWFLILLLCDSITTWFYYIIVHVKHNLKMIFLFDHVIENAIF